MCIIYKLRPIKITICIYQDEEIPQGSWKLPGSTYCNQKIQHPSSSAVKLGNPPTYWVTSCISMQLYYSVQS